MHTATLVPGWAQMQGAPLFPFPLSQGPFLAHPSPTVCLCSVLSLLLAHHHDNQARLFPVGLGLSRR